MDKKKKQELIAQFFVLQKEDVRCYTQLTALVRLTTNKSRRSITHRCLVDNGAFCKPIGREFVSKLNMRIRCQIIREVWKHFLKWRSREMM